MTTSWSGAVAAVSTAMTGSLPGLPVTVTPSVVTESPLGLAAVLTGAEGDGVVPPEPELQAPSSRGMTASAATRDLRMVFTLIAVTSRR